MIERSQMDLGLSPPRAILPKDTPRVPSRPTLWILSVGFAAIGTISASAWLCGLRINVTPSEPLGLWRIVPLERQVAVGDLVFVCPPQGSTSIFGLERGYLHGGLCPGGIAPLIKTVAALPGARVDVGTDVAIDGIALPSSRISQSDGRGRPLVPWPGGIVPAGDVFFHSPFAGSYDSRYFGPIPAAGILGVARPVFTWDP
jgi:conjugative transfer signal peptidase TraF